MTGYVRQSSAEIVTGQTINASDFNDEFNQLQGAFDAATGHSHNGGVGEGAPLTRSSLSGFGANTGIVVVNAPSTFAARTLTGTANEITVTNGDGVAGNPTFSLPSALTFTGKTITGGTFTGSTFTGLTLPWASITSTPTTLAGYGITDAQPLDADLTAIAAIATNGLIARTGAGTAAARTVTGTANEITVTNGDGAAANPTLSLPAALTFTGKTVTGGTFNDIAIGGTSTVPWARITSTPTTVAGYGITDAVPTSRTLTGGTGIATIGDLSVNRTIAIDTAVVARYTATQTWTAVQVPLTAALTDGATVNWAAGSAQVATVTCTAARTFAAPTGLTANAWYALVITNSGGAWNHAFNAVFIWDTNDGTPTGIPSGGRGIFIFVSDGTNLREAGRRITAS